VTVSQVVTESELVQHSELFENSISGGDRGALRDFCNAKAAASQARSRVRARARARAHTHTHTHTHAPQWDVASGPSLGRPAWCSTWRPDGGVPTGPSASPCAPSAPPPRQGADEAETWTFMAVLFEDDPRRQLLQKLGFADALAAAQQQQQQQQRAVARASSASVAAAAEHLASAVEQIGLDGEAPAPQPPPGRRSRARC
jgi:hypothetical protein